MYCAEAAAAAAADSILERCPNVLQVLQLNEFLFLFAMLTICLLILHLELEFCLFFSLLFFHFSAAFNLGAATTNK